MGRSTVSPRSSAKRCLVVVPVFGQIAMTHDLIPEILRESNLVDVLVVDNRGDYVPYAAERVATPGTNLGWAGGSNLGFRIAFREGYTHAMTLNNDTRLSPGFFAGVLDERLPGDAGLIGPMYDDTGGHGWQKAEFDGPAAEYEPVERYWQVPCFDGTAMMISAGAWEAAGEIDERTFGKYGWGANLDWCLRVADAGFGIYLTEMSYMNHLGRKTATANTHNLRYLFDAIRGLRGGMSTVYGRKWRDKFKHAPQPCALAEEVSA
ncbi:MULTISPECIES: glycosyltransferase family 2 protein [unclassified Rhodococcus (in: high G+C Gram-positive bacteria)]|uniref:glycosyltransferase family 2 protein n=1 Tax=unclassified Rhodococcus (in: high G+C Gram-positive bacteria) TaxID=192944 RepID=UPI001BB3389D